MNILMLTTKFVHPDGSLWLSSELANALHHAGHNVTVYNLSWSGLVSASSEIDSSILVKNFRALRYRIPSAFSLPLRWILSSWKVCFGLVWRFIFRRKKYDLIIAFSPCTAIYAVAPLLNLISRNSFLIYWDFFPIHNQEISHKAPVFLIPVLKFIENRILNKFDNVGFLTPASVEFAKKYFSIGSDVCLHVLPVWTSFLQNKRNNFACRVMDNCSLMATVDFVFGGQLVQGRGLLEFIDAFLLAYSENSAIRLTICGDGILVDKVIALQTMYPNVIIYKGFLSRADYLDLLSEMDVGVVSTMADVAVPCFPSKSLDYMASSLPILAAVDKANDFGQLIADAGAGICCFADDIYSVRKAIIDMAFSWENRLRMGKSANSYLIANHSVGAIVNKILEV